MSQQAEYRGVPASPGIVLAPAYVLRRERLVIPEYAIDREVAPAEIERLARAFDETRARLEGIREGMQETGLVGDIFNAQFLFLEDPTLIANANRNIEELGLNAEWALQRELRRLQRLFESIADPYIRERSSDVGFVVRRVLQALMGREPEGLANAPRGVIVAAEDLSPGEMAQLKRGQVAGIVTVGGSRTSHVTIMARSLEIPAVVGAAGGWLTDLADGVQVVLDGSAGRILVAPNPETVAEYEKRRSDTEQLERRLLQYAPLPAETRDGVSVSMLANVELVDEIPIALRHGGEGIGLFRTEFLFMNRTDLPDEEEQLAAYRDGGEVIEPLSCVFRTLDLGGDKVPTGLSLAEEPNPALGLRGIRMSLHRPELYRVQLRALLRASEFGSPKVLIPMVSTLSEVQFARQVFDEVRDEVVASGLPQAARVEFGVMIETPAAALIAELIAPHVDFFSIGTNDLIQYTLAVDRANDQVGYLYEPLHPANLRMIQQVCQAGRRAGIGVGGCGEMAGDPINSWILLALGVKELSMTPFSIPLLKKILRDSTIAEARSLVSDVLELGSAAEIRVHVEGTMRSRFPIEFEQILGNG